MIEKIDNRPLVDKVRQIILGYGTSRNKSERILSLVKTELEGSLLTEKEAGIVYNHAYMKDGAEFDVCLGAVAKAQLAKTLGRMGV